MMKKALGKGLGVFLPDDYGILKEERFAEIEIGDVLPNPLQPRMKFNPESIDELAQSIRETGVIQPIVVVPEGDNYKIIVGERRWRAAQKAGLKRIPALVRTIPKEKQLEVSLVENLQRESLNPLEVAIVFQRMMEEFYLHALERGESPRRIPKLDLLRAVEDADALQRGVLLDKVHLALLTRSHVPQGGPDAHYGYGTIVETTRGVMTYGHGGMHAARISSSRSTPIGRPCWW